ncbi:hypothetical protein SynA1825c_01451 [Synechococcus sp. A18-25c]|nr:hypothetical protein SynA1825c_01451 [Synechococcus sp. A18-25c]
MQILSRLSPNRENEGTGGRQGNASGDHSRQSIPQSRGLSLE